MTCRHLQVHQSKKQNADKKQLAFQSQMSFVPFDATTFFFHKHGSCFNQLQAPLTDPDALPATPIGHVDQDELDNGKKKEADPSDFLKGIFAFKHLQV